MLKHVSRISFSFILGKSLRFTGGLTTGISAPTANQLSFDTSGVERMTVASQITAKTRFIATTTRCYQGVAFFRPINGESIEVSADTSIVALEIRVSPITVTIKFPKPANGQLLTLMLIAPPGDPTFPVSLINDGGDARIADNAVTELDPTRVLDPTRGGSSVTYIFFEATGYWYVYARG